MVNGYVENDILSEFCHGIESMHTNQNCFFDITTNRESNIFNGYFQETI